MPEHVEKASPAGASSGGPAGEEGAEAIPSLVSSAAEGDEAAMRELFDRFHDSVMGYCVLATNGDRDRAKDLTQKSFIAVFEGLDDLEDPERFESWIWTIVRRQCSDHASRRSRHGDILELFELTRDVVMADEEKPLREARIACVRDLLEDVDDDKLRRIVEMKYTEPEHTTREIADELDIPHGTVTVKLMRFRESVEDELAERLRNLDITIAEQRTGR